jgi:hypothetical protein
MGNGMRTQVVEVLIRAGAPTELITAVSPDMVLGETLTSAPKSQTVREVPATGKGPVQAAKDDGSASGSPSPIQSAIESAVESPDSVIVSSRTRAAAQKATAAKAADRRARAASDRARADRGPALATAAPRSVARPATRPVARPVARPVVRPVERPAPKPAPKPAPAKGPGKAAPATDHGGKPGPVLRRVATRQEHDRYYAVASESRGPERRATGRGASRHAAPVRSNREQHSNWGRGQASRRDQGPDRSSYDSRRHDSRHQADRGSQRGSGGGGQPHGGGRGGHGPSGHRH